MYSHKQHASVLVSTSVFLFETDRKKKISEPDVCAIRTTAKGVWLSTPISAAVTFNSPIITATVEPPAWLQQAPGYLW